MANKPGMRPVTPHFSSGPCAKRPGWSLKALEDAALGRSHRSKLGKARLQYCIDLIREVLEVPEYTANFAWGDDDYRSLFITASTSLYRVRRHVPGLPAF